MVGERRQAEQANWRRTAGRWWYILRYHRPSQLAMRLVRMMETRSRRTHWERCCQRAFAEKPAIRTNAGLIELARHKLQEHASPESRRRAERVLQGYFEFLHQELRLPDPVDWRLSAYPGTAHLWRFHLHYHEFLLDLAAEGLRTGEPPWMDKGWRLVRDWIENNRLGDRRVLGDAWHPYCISRRLAVWIHLWAVAPPAPEDQAQILGSLLGQARYLEHHLEWDVRGNHLLENLRTLALCGAFLAGPEADRWLSTAARLLKRELAEQILPHGEHFERSPMYHAAMLEAILEVRHAVAGLDPELAGVCGQTAARMADFLRAILHPDGEIPMLGDSSLGHIPSELGRVDPIAARHAPAQSPAAGAQQIGPYWVFQSDGDFVLFDAGPVGPDHLPAHAHADLLSLEASLGGRRLLVDSGVYNYTDDAMRQYCRSSAAHNVLQIDGRDQCDMWSRFRMGYRGWPSSLTCGEQSGFFWARAAHNAYRRLRVPVVGRWLACRPGGPWFCVDWANGDGCHDLVAWLHLHPEVTVHQVAASQVLLRLGDIPLRLEWLTPGLVTQTESWYCPQLGLRQKVPTVFWQASRTLPAIGAWCLTWGMCEGTASLDLASCGDPVLQWTEHGQITRFTPFADHLK
jgi:uncharacterized heparinase superfamily protein